MANDPIKSIKEAYVSQGNLQAMTQKWLEDIDFYSKNKFRFKFVPSSSALLVIDMQKYFLDEDSHAYIPASKAILPNIKNLVLAYRKADLPVIFTRHSLEKNEEPGIMGRWWGDVIWEESSLSEIETNLAPKNSDIVIRKTRYSAFYGTDLETFLRNKNVKSLVITGVMTHLCCESTAREAFMRDYEVYFAVNGTATQNEELHLSSLRTLSNGFSVPITCEEILKEFKEMQI